MFCALAPAYIAAECEPTSASRAGAADERPRAVSLSACLPASQPQCAVLCSFCFSSVLSRLCSVRGHLCTERCSGGRYAPLGVVHGFGLTRLLSAGTCLW